LYSPTLSLTLPYPGLYKRKLFLGGSPQPLTFLWAYLRLHRVKGSEVVIYSIEESTDSFVGPSYSLVHANSLCSEELMYPFRILADMDTSSKYWKIHALIKYLFLEGGGVDRVFSDEDAAPLQQLQIAVTLIDKAYKTAGGAEKVPNTFRPEDLRLAHQNTARKNNRSNLGTGSSQGGPSTMRTDVLRRQAQDAQSAQSLPEDGTIRPSIEDLTSLVERLQSPSVEPIPPIADDAAGPSNNKRKRTAEDADQLLEQWQQEEMRKLRKIRDLHALRARIARMVKDEQRKLQKARGKIDAVIHSIGEEEEEEGDIGGEDGGVN
jgi:hypothetical protein